MAWEKRGNLNYFYRKKRIGGKIKSVYVGSGDIAELIEQSDKIDKLRADAAAEQLKRKRIEADALDDKINELSEINQILVDALFLINGFHQHKRQWRKIRKRTI